MVIHCIAASKEAVEIVVADVQTDGEADCRPYGISATNPVFEAEHVLGIDTEFPDLLRVGGQSDEMLRDV